MAWAQELKSLVEEIPVLRADRIKYVQDIKTDVRKFLVQVDGELKDMAKDLQVFLNKSEATRMEDFKGMMSGIKKDVQHIQKETHALLKEFNKEMKQLAADLKVFLAKSERDRLADFKPMMQRITSEINDLKKETAHLLGTYQKERHEAAGYWAALRKKTRVAGAPPRARKGIPRKAA